MNCELYYPGFVRKAITFSIDDGNVPNDKKFLDIVKPCGIKGTFNLCSHNLRHLSREGYVEFYRGYEIANHCKYHPFVFNDWDEYRFADTPFDERTADPALVYPRPGYPGQYMCHVKSGWRMVTDAEHYLLYEQESRRELEELFGEGTVNGFVWPYGKQGNREVYETLCSRGYYGLRKTGNTFDLDAFAIPKDRNNWSYNANNVKLLEVAAMYEACPDDGTLKFFCFGVHSIDFERSGNWDELETFAKTYGNRPDTYYYASVGEIFAYEDAARELLVEENAVTNPSSVTLYLKCNGRELVLAPQERAEL